MPDRKDFASRVKIKDAAKGQVSAVFSTFDVIDKDGDVTIPEAIKDGTPIVVSAYGHQSWSGELPVGSGVIRTTKTEAIADMQFFLDTTHGLDTFNAVAALAKKGLSEWSYGFSILDAEPAIVDEKEVRMLKALNVFEVSPVLQGAGVNTRTLVAKAAKEGGSLPAHVPYKSAIRPHDSKTTDGDWDESKSISAIARDATVTDLRSMYAWVDSSADPESKASYKFLHHEKANGEANIRACITGIALLNGARGGGGIPKEDRQEVYNHLKSHLEDAGREVPELRAEMSYGSLKFTDECAAVMAAVSGLINRAQEIHEMRIAKGKTMSRSSVELLEWLESDLRKLKALIDTPQEDLARELLRFIQMGNENA